MNKLPSKVQNKSRVGSTCNAMDARRTSFCQGDGNHQCCEVGSRHRLTSIARCNLKSTPRHRLTSTPPRCYGGAAVSRRTVTAAAVALCDVRLAVFNDFRNRRNSGGPKKTLAALQHTASLGPLAATTPI